MPLPSAIAAAVPPSREAVTASAAQARSPHLRPVLWAGGATLLIALLVLTPPLVNANRYRNKIAESMSKSLGRPVHLDNVSLHLLPIPGFRLQNLVVSEDPDFGAEPTIRANTVEATLRVSSLWRRPVEFSTVRFVEPSVNLVRNAEGRWNISEVLMHASRVDSAPTTQGHAGAAPRFPYIEATGGRVNVKLGAEKLAFSLTDTDFALWLPSPRQWRVRLVGHPARTDTNITDPGTLRVEGDLQRAATLMAVPVNFRASWHDAPLGEATRILSGSDMGWRGSLNVDATLGGTLGNAHLETKATLGGLRRAEFFPAHPLDLQITCGSTFAVHPATLSGLRCVLPTGGPLPLTLAAETVHLQGVASTSATLQGASIPLHWPLLWAGLFSPRISTDLQAVGTMDVNVSRSPAPTDGPDGPDGPGSAGWSGLIRLAFPSPTQTVGDDSPANVMDWRVGTSATPGDDGVWPTLSMSSTSLSLGPAMRVGVEGSMGSEGYKFLVSGDATPAALLIPARYLPQLGDGMGTLFPAGDASTGPEGVSFTCTRAWTATQTCSGSIPAVVPRPRPAIRRAGRARAH